MSKPLLIFLNEVAGGRKLLEAAKSTGPVCEGRYY